MATGRIFKILVGAGAIWLGAPVSCLAGDEVDAGKATVMIDGLPVYVRASLESTLVASIAKGEAVSVKVEMMGAGADGPWCGISLSGMDGVAGFVQCGYLVRGSGREEEWRLLGSSVTHAGTETTKVIINGNRVLVPVAISNGWKKEKFTLLLDTGAGITFIHSNAASRLKMNLGGAEKGSVRVADGSVVPVNYVRIDDMRVGPHVLKDKKISIADYSGPKSDHDGLLGMDVLRELNYRIDFERQEIVWE